MEDFFKAYLIEKENLYELNFYVFFVQCVIFFQNFEN